MQITAAQALLRTLKQNGTEILFGYPGAALSPVYAALQKEGGLRHILARTEQGAAHMAAASFRTTGKPGVCLATSGPGATNLLTAVANAYMDSVPLIAITAQVASAQVGTDAFQEVDTTGVTTPVTKHNYLVKHAADLPQIVNDAFYIAASGRPGPVVIDLPFDVLKTKIDWLPPQRPHLCGYRLPDAPRAEDAAAFADRLRRAERPLAVFGGGVVSGGAQHELVRFLAASGLPSVCTMMGLSALPSDFPQFCGMTGIHGTLAAREAFDRADCILFIGSRITERTVSQPAKLAARAAVLHIDIDPAEIQKNCPADLAVCADCKAFLPLLAAQFTAPLPQWVQTPKITPCEAVASKYVSPERLFAALRQKLSVPVVLSTEVGQNQIWTSRYFRFMPGDIFLTSGGFGTMGYGLPAAIGAKIYAPHKTVIAIEGDGSFQMAFAELAAMMENRAPIKMIVFKNNCLGLVREAERVSARTPHVHLGAYPDYCKLAAAYAIPSRRLDNDRDIAAALDEMLQTDGAFLLEAAIRPSART